MHVRTDKAPPVSQRSPYIVCFFLRAEKKLQREQLTARRRDTFEQPSLTAQKPQELMIWCERLVAESQDQIVRCNT